MYGFTFSSFEVCGTMFLCLLSTPRLCFSQSPGARWSLSCKDEERKREEENMDGDATLWLNQSPPAADVYASNALHSSLHGGSYELLL